MRLLKYCCKDTACFLIPPRRIFQTYGNIFIFNYMEDK